MLSFRTLKNAIINVKKNPPPKKKKCEFEIKFRSKSIELFFAWFKLDVGWLFGLYGISTFVGYLTQNPFSYK